ATVARELRTPRTPSLAWSNMLRTEELGSERRTVALGAIEQSARAQAQLIDDLLDVSRIVSGEWRLALRPVELAPAIEAAVEVMRPPADAKGVRLEVSLPEVAVPILGDPDRLQQIVSNLLSNAVKFTPRGGLVQ